MVNSLLQLSRMDSEEDTFEKEKVNFTLFFHKIIDRFDMNVKDERIILNSEIPDKEAFVWMDRDKMTQVLDNIISNDVKYLLDGGLINLNIENETRQRCVSN